MSMIWEISAESDPARSRESVDRCGFAVLRGVLERDAVLDLARALETEFARLDRIEPSLPEELRKSLSRSELPAHEQQARFRLEPARYEHLTSSKRLASHLRAIAGEDFLWHYPPMFRRVDAGNAVGCLPFHQDYTYNAKYKGLMTCFTPLGDCGVDAPGLELVERGALERLDHGSDGLWEFGLSEQKIQALFPDARLHRPALRAGDVIVFRENTLHRTHHHPGMTKIRRSMDARAIPLSCISGAVRAQRKFILPQEAAFASPS